MKLYAIRGCPFAWRSRIALEEKSIPFELVLYEAGRRPPELDAASPDAKSPTLFDGAVAVWESLIVNEYLEDRYHEKPLLPSDPVGRARVRLAIHAVEKKLMSRHTALVKEAFLKAPEERDDAAVEEARRQWREALALFDAKLAGREFLAGDRFSLADVAMYPPIPTARHIAGEEVPAELGNLRAWLDRMSARPAMHPIEPPQR
ncbi:MAG TPA: glutathione S-transferase family protein [Kofleriaceae bacterium]|nr:glutathione S-transferase family protein [Kofleriaceae bacterium]